MPQHLETIRGLQGDDPGGSQTIDVLGHIQEAYLKQLGFTDVPSRFARIARRALYSRLPIGWNRYRFPNGVNYYLHEKSGVLSSSNPVDEFYKTLVEDVFHKAAARIQGLQRKRRASVKVNQIRLEQKYEEHAPAIRVVQAAVRGYMARKTRARKLQEKNQNGELFKRTSWVGHVNRGEGRELWIGSVLYANYFTVCHKLIMGRGLPLLDDRVKEYREYSYMTKKVPCEPATLKEFAQYLGVDWGKEFYLLPVVRMAVMACPPPEWLSRESEGGSQYYLNVHSHEELSAHPADSFFRELITMTRRRMGSRRRGCPWISFAAKYPATYAVKEDQTYWYNFHTTACVSAAPLEYLKSRHAVAVIERWVKRCWKQRNTAVAEAKSVQPEKTQSILTSDDVVFLSREFLVAEGVEGLEDIDVDVSPDVETVKMWYSIATDHAATMLSSGSTAPSDPEIELEVVVSAREAHDDKKKSLCVSIPSPAKTVADVQTGRSVADVTPRNAEPVAPKETVTAGIQTESPGVEEAPAEGRIESGWTETESAAESGAQASTQAADLSEPAPKPIGPESAVIALLGKKVYDFVHARKGDEILSVPEIQQEAALKLLLGSMLDELKQDEEDYWAEDHAQALESMLGVISNVPMVHDAKGVGENGGTTGSVGLGGGDRDKALEVLLGSRLDDLERLRKAEAIAAVADVKEKTREKESSPDPHGTSENRITRHEDALKVLLGCRYEAVAQGLGKPLPKSFKPKLKPLKSAPGSHTRKKEEVVRQSVPPLRLNLIEPSSDEESEADAENPVGDDDPVQAALNNYDKQYKSQMGITVPQGLPSGRSSSYDGVLMAESEGHTESMTPMEDTHTPSSGEHSDSKRAGAFSNMEIASFLPPGVTVSAAKPGDNVQVSPASTPQLSMTHEQIEGLLSSPPKSKKAARLDVSGGEETGRTHASDSTVSCWEIAQSSNRHTFEPPAHLANRLLLDLRKLPVDSSSDENSEQYTEPTATEEMSAGVTTGEQGGPSVGGTTLGSNTEGHTSASGNLTPVIVTNSKDLEDDSEGEKEEQGWGVERESAEDYNIGEAASPQQFAANHSGIIGLPGTMDRVISYESYDDDEEPSFNPFKTAGGGPMSRPSWAVEALGSLLKGNVEVDDKDAESEDEGSPRNDPTNISSTQTNAPVSFGSPDDKDQVSELNTLAGMNRAKSFSMPQIALTPSLSPSPPPQLPKRTKDPRTTNIGNISVYSNDETGSEIGDVRQMVKKKDSVVSMSTVSNRVLGDIVFEDMMLVDGFSFPEGNYFFQDGPVAAEPGVGSPSLDRMGVFSPHYDDTVLSLRSLKWIMNDDFDSLTEAQKSLPPSSQLRRWTFQQCRDELLKVLNSGYDVVELFMKFIGLRRLGKTKWLRSCADDLGYAGDYGQDMLAFVLCHPSVELWHYFPSFAIMSTPMQNLMLECLSCPLNLGQLLQGECGASSMSDIGDCERLKLKMMLGLVDIMGSEGHVNMNGSLAFSESFCSIFMITWNAILSYGDRNQGFVDCVDVYKDILKARAEKVNYTLASRKDIVKTRFSMMMRARAEGNAAAIVSGVIDDLDPKILASLEVELQPYEEGEIDLYGASQVVMLCETEEQLANVVKGICRVLQESRMLMQGETRLEPFVVNLSAMKPSTETDDIDVVRSDGVGWEGVVVCHQEDGEQEVIQKRRRSYHNWMASVHQFEQQTPSNLYGVDKTNFFEQKYFFEDVTKNSGNEPLPEGSPSVCYGGVYVYEFDRTKRSLNCLIHYLDGDYNALVGSDEISCNVSEDTFHTLRQDFMKTFDSPELISMLHRHLCIRDLGTTKPLKKLASRLHFDGANPSVLLSHVLCHPDIDLEGMFPSFRALSFRLQQIVIDNLRSPLRLNLLLRGECGSSCLRMILQAKRLKMKMYMAFFEALGENVGESESMAISLISALEGVTNYDLTNTTDEVIPARLYKEIVSRRAEAIGYTVESNEDVAKARIAMMLGLVTPGEMSQIVEESCRHLETTGSSEYRCLVEEMTWSGDGEIAVKGAAYVFDNMQHSWRNIGGVERNDKLKQVKNFILCLVRVFEETRTSLAGEKRGEPFILNIDPLFDIEQGRLVDQNRVSVKRLGNSWEGMAVAPEATSAGASKPVRFMNMSDQLSPLEVMSQAALKLEKFADRDDTTQPPAVTPFSSIRPSPVNRSPLDLSPKGSIDGGKSGSGNMQSLKSSLPASVPSSVPSMKFTSTLASEKSPEVLTPSSESHSVIARPGVEEGGDSAEELPDLATFSSEDVSVLSRMQTKFRGRKTLEPLQNAPSPKKTHPVDALDSPKKLDVGRKPVASVEGSEGLSAQSTVSKAENAGSVYKEAVADPETNVEAAKADNVIISDDMKTTKPPPRTATVDYNEPQLPSPARVERVSSGSNRSATRAPIRATPKRISNTLAVAVLSNFNAARSTKDSKKEGGRSLPSMKGTGPAVGVSSGKQAMSVLASVGSKPKAR